MARNLFDDEDWQHLSQIVGDAVSKQIEVTENGVLARIDKRATDQGITLEAILGRMGEPAQETLALRTTLHDVSGLVAQLRRVIGSGNLETELNAQVSNLFGQLNDRLAGVPAPPTPLADAVLSTPTA